MCKAKVLIVGINAWVDNTGINTLINFFDGYGADNLAHVYTNGGNPNTLVCNNFFKIDENLLTKSVFNKKVKTGKQVFNQATTQNGRSLVHKKHGALLSLAREVVWSLGRWKTKELNDFLDEFNPEVLFFPTYASAHMNKLQLYIANYLKKPIILYASDDNYSYKSVKKDPISILLRRKTRKYQKGLFEKASKVLVISTKQKEEYDRLFNCNSVVMTKGIDYSGLEFVYKAPQLPLKMVYTGKLIIGRGETLISVAKAINKLNKEKRLIELDVYTTDKLTKRQNKFLNSNGVKVKGAITPKQTLEVQSGADVLLFVEGLSKSTRFKARLSFSTKITDYLKSGKCIFAVGDKDIAPIDYFKRYDSAICATNESEIHTTLEKITSDLTLVGKYGQKAFECGKTHHEKALQKNILDDAIIGALKDEQN